ncbi:ABC transporter permease [Bailinhaonella thermotolerans]|uniref:ABC transporter permease n=1 Tax=Bailinhaonella thermotolerans TaxID=1070861 RepID=A0A3A4A6R6_9ACTN|nr:ABC transporter permease [Bailinhaonella thermotolerans]RJL22717.1 ABC transporter permease [Bailinhaonella thermotolerans]
MFWLTWRQHRAQMLVTASFLLALGALLLGSAIEAAVYAAAHAPPGCPGPSVACAEVGAGLSARYQAVYSLYGWMPLLAPALIGAFWGAPLLGREYERGTHLLAWTQSVSPARWLAVKLGVLGGAVALGGLALSAMATAWRASFPDSVAGTWFGNLGVFNMVGVVPAAWWAFAFATGAAAGAFLRRTLPAMAVTVAVVAAAVFGLFSLSDHYAEPARTVTTDRAAVFARDSRLLREAWVAPSGAETEAVPMTVCPSPPDAGRSGRNAEARERCLFQAGYRLAVYHHPPERFWRFQWIEAGILLAASAVLGAAAVARTLRR